MQNRTKAILAATAMGLAGLLFVVPALAATTQYFMSYDASTGARVTPGTITTMDTITLDEPAGAVCTVVIEHQNQLSVHPGNNLVLLHNGDTVAEIEGIEEVPFETTSATGTFIATGSDTLVLGVESTLVYITSGVGSAVITCESEPPGTTTTSEPPGTTTTTEPPGTTTTSEPPGTTTTTEPPVTTTSGGVPGAPPAGPTPTAPGSHAETGADMTTLYGLLAMVFGVGSMVAFRLRRTDG
ncbi:hypothetical protein BH24ACT7_BH24ACT7_11920 [soil metagenome]